MQKDRIMKRTLSAMALTLLCVAANAQETYENAPLASKDLNGTARYVGMGGAMEALGADISTMGTNPAGIGLFRKSTASISFGVVSQSEANSFANANKTNMSFDQAGFVYAMRSGRNSYVNFGFNYSKSRNFDQILSAAGALNSASQNKLSGLKNYNGVYQLKSKNGTLSSEYNTANQLDYLYSNVILGDQNAALVDKDGNTLGDGTYGYLVNSTTLAPTYYNATNYQFSRGNTGYIGQYDFNISGNANDRIYWGVTFGLYDVHYNNESLYKENLVNGDQSIGSVSVNDVRQITGTGFDVKFGVIVRPIEESPFRVGLYAHTPTWYDLRTANYTRLTNGLSSEYGAHDYGENSESYDFKFYTPWRFGVSLGHTVGSNFAIGATYEYADYSSCDVRINDGGTYDYWGNYYEESHRDAGMKENIKQVLKGVSTFKVGVEYKPEKNLAVRLGYNYVSPMYNKAGYKDGTIDSYGTFYSSTTDYTNWKATNRITAGVGYTYNKLFIDLAYQYSQTNGEFYPFMSYTDNSNSAYDNVCESAKVSNKRHQVLLTLGYKF
jgi:hypothetical protein